MTKEELRKTQEYKNCIAKIKKYPKGFEFTIYPSQMPKTKYNALNIILKDCAKKDLITSIAIGINLNGDITEETYRRL